MKILFIDDNHMLRDVVYQYGLVLNHEIITFENGIEAIKHYKTNPVDLIITDMCMGVIRGEDVLYEMKQINPECKIIASTGNSLEDNIRDLLKLGFNHVLTKPFSLEDFKNAIMI